MINLPTNWQTCERGNTWLQTEELHIAWFELPGTKQKLEVSVTPENYPGFYVAILSEEQSTDEHLAEHINENCQGWQIHKCNIPGVKRSSENCVETDD